jgi:SAM-dependent methyltransferase
VDLTCICCGGGTFRHFRSLKGYTFVRCDACGFVTAHPLPDVAVVEAHYNETRTGEERRRQRRALMAEFLAKPNNPKRDYFRDVLAKVASMLGKPSLDILEIGSGHGYFVHYANTCGHRATGTEATERYAEMSSESLNGRIVHVDGDRYEDHFAPASFDLIYMEAVFEHMLRPEAVLAQMRRLLRPGGVLFVAVPNQDALSSRMQGRYWAWAAPPDHLYFYNRANLSLLLEKHGFRVAEALTRDYYHRSIPQMYSLRRALNIGRRLLGKEPAPYRYAYPETVRDHLMLLPYYILYPLIRRSWRGSGGSELVIYARNGTGAGAGSASSRS